MTFSKMKNLDNLLSKGKVIKGKMKRNREQKAKKLERKRWKCI